MKTKVEEYQDGQGKNRVRTVAEENGNKLTAVTQGYSKMEYARRAMVRSGVAVVEKYQPGLLNKAMVDAWKQGY